MRSEVWTLPPWTCWTKKTTNLSTKLLKKEVWHYMGSINSLSYVWNSKSISWLGLTCNYLQFGTQRDNTFNTLSSRGSCICTTKIQNNRKSSTRLNDFTRHSFKPNPNKKFEKSKISINISQSHIFIHDKRVSLIGVYCLH